MAGIDANTALALHLDGADTSTSFLDSSRTPKTMTAHGNAQVDTAQSVFGGASGIFSGSTDYLDTPAHSSFGFGTGDFSVDFRFRMGTVADSSIIGNGFDVGWLVQFVDSQNPKKIRLWLAGNNLDFPGTLAVATWYHLEFDRTNGTVFSFVDGVILGTAMGTFSVAGTTVLRVASDTTATSGQIFGWIDELRIQSGTFSNNANFTPPTAAYSDDSVGGAANFRSLLGVGI